MLVGFFVSRTISNLVGYAYPAYASFKIIQEKKRHKYAEWLMYWAVISCFTAVEVFGDVLVSWLPFYYEAKVAFIIWLVCNKKAAVTLYQKYLHPALESYEGHIDRGIDDAAREAQRGAVHVGKMGMKVLRSHSVSLLQMGQQALVSTATMAAQADQEEKRAKKGT